MGGNRTVVSSKRRKNPPIVRVEYRSSLELISVTSHFAQGEIIRDLYKVLNAFEHTSATTQVSTSFYSNRKLHVNFKVSYKNASF